MYRFTVTGCHRKTAACHVTDPSMCYCIYCFIIVLNCTYCYYSIDDNKVSSSSSFSNTVNKQIGYCPNVPRFEAVIAHMQPILILHFVFIQFLSNNLPTTKPSSKMRGRRWTLQIPMTSLPLKVTGKQADQKTPEKNCEKKTSRNGGGGGGG